MVYIMLGMIVSRRMYALQQHRYNISGNREKAAEIEDKMKAMRHDGTCYQRVGGSYYNPARVCDCYNADNKNTWRRLNRELQEIRTGSEPSNPWLMMLTYPAVGIDAWLKGGTVKDNSFTIERVHLDERIKE